MKQSEHEQDPLDVQLLVVITENGITTLPELIEAITPGMEPKIAQLIHELCESSCGNFKSPGYPGWFHTLNRNVLSLFISKNLAGNKIEHFQTGYVLGLMAALYPSLRTDDLLGANKKMAPGLLKPFDIFKQITGVLDNHYRLSDSVEKSGKYFEGRGAGLNAGLRFEKPFHDGPAIFALQVMILILWRRISKMSSISELYEFLASALPQNLAGCEVGRLAKFSRRKCQGLVRNERIPF